MWVCRTKNLLSLEFELIIDAGNPDNVVVALLENQKLIELHSESNESGFMVGDIYHGKIKKIIPSLNAAFVDVGYEKDAFLHYHDLGPQFRSFDKFVFENWIHIPHNLQDLYFD